MNIRIQRVESDKCLICGDPFPFFSVAMLNHIDKSQTNLPICPICAERIMNYLFSLNPELENIKLSELQTGIQYKRNRILYHIYRYTIQVIKGIQKYINRFRFQENTATDLRFPWRNYRSSTRLSLESHKSTKLVTGPPAGLGNGMATAAPPSRSMKPSQENVDYFYVHALEVKDRSLHIKQHRGNGTAICGTAVVFAEYINGKEVHPDDPICPECQRLWEIRGITTVTAGENAVSKYRGGCPRCGQYKWAFRLGLPKGVTEISCMNCGDHGFQVTGQRFGKDQEWIWICTIDPRRDHLYRPEE